MSDEIPVGSPPAPPGRHAAPGGWYGDPTDPERERYWDGWQWSRQTREAQTPRRPGARSRTDRAAAGPSTTDPVRSSVQGHSDGEGRPGQMAGPQQGQRLSGPRPDTEFNGLMLAGWWRRAGAALLDAVLLWIVSSLILSPIYLRINARMAPLLEEMLRQAQLGEPITPLKTEELMSSQESNMILIALVVVGVLYHVAMIRTVGATVGKLAAGLRVIPVESDGADKTRSGLDRVSVRQCVTRALMWIVPAQISCLWPFWILDVVFPLRQARRQSLHDVGARTVVVMVRGRHGRSGGPIAGRDESQGD